MHLLKPDKRAGEATNHRASLFLDWPGFIAASRKSLNHTSDSASRIQSIRWIYTR